MLLLFLVFLIFFMLSHMKIVFVPITDECENFSDKTMYDVCIRSLKLNHWISSTPTYLTLYNQARIKFRIPELSVLQYMWPSLHSFIVGWILHWSLTYYLIFVPIYVIYSLIMIYIFYRVLKYKYGYIVPGGRFSY